jgi:hypothetical protein
MIVTVIKYGHRKNRISFFSRYKTMLGILFKLDRAKAKQKTVIRLRTNTIQVKFLLQKRNRKDIQ